MLTDEQIQVHWIQIRLQVLLVNDETAFHANDCRTSDLFGLILITISTDTRIALDVVLILKKPRLMTNILYKRVFHYITKISIRNR